VVIESPQSKNVRFSADFILCDVISYSVELPMHVQSLEELDRSLKTGWTSYFVYLPCLLDT
jgi:hypothetical protein